MSYFNQISIQASDSPSIDAFARLRVSDPFTIFDSKQLYDTGSLVWSTKIIGNATASYNTNNASVYLNAVGNPSSVVRQTKKRMNYQPSKSSLIICTGNFSGSNANTIKRIGYFDANNGVYFVSTGSSFGIGIRTNTSGTPTDTFISQSSWNLDTFNGTGASGKTLNLSTSQIFFMDFEWLGVGRVRYGIFQSGIPTYVHQITNANILNTVYMSTPNLPIRYECINSGSSQQSLLHVCSAVQSEGGIENNGTIRSISNAISAFSITATNNSLMLAIRLKPTATDGTVTPLRISTGTGASATYEAMVLLNPSGSVPWSWQNLPNSIVQYATGSVLNTIQSEGTKLYSSIVGGASSVDSITTDPTLGIGTDLDGVSDVIAVGWRGIATNATNACATLTWRESV